VGAPLPPDGGATGCHGGGGVYSFGDAAHSGRWQSPLAAVVGLAATATEGYWLPRGGAVYGFGDAPAAWRGQRPGVARQRAGGKHRRRPGNAGFWLAPPEDVLGYSGAPTYGPPTCRRSVRAATPDAEGTGSCATPPPPGRRRQPALSTALPAARGRMGYHRTATATGWHRQRHVFSTARRYVVFPRRPLAALCRSRQRIAHLTPPRRRVNITTTALPGLVAGHAYSAQLQLGAPALLLDRGRRALPPAWP